MREVGQPRVLLVSPPWTSLNEPSLGLSILKAVLTEQGIAARVHHLNLFTLDFLRADTYAALGHTYALNDFVFSGVLDPTPSRRQLRVLREKCAELAALGLDHRRHGGIAGLVDRMLHLRSEVIPRWVDLQARSLLESRPTLVGFTCMFDQTIASAAISARLRALDPTVMLVLGGYAVRPPTGAMVLGAFPWIDAICTGEGEPCIPALARASVTPGRDLSLVPNLLFRDHSGRIVTGPKAPPVDMDSVPAPDFDDFYADVRRLSRDHQVDVAIDRLPVENSRGCWWGASHHCVFCGIHDDDLAYRSRSAESVLRVLAQLSQRYGAREFRFADYILPHGYYSTLLPELVKAGAPYRIKCELKANLTASKARLLASAGFIEVQPGIESFGSSMLAAMDKGVSGIQNVHLLLLGRRFGVAVLYNIIYGLPGEDPQAVEAMVRALPNLRHLDPPSTRGRIQITRFAPLQTDPARFGLGALRHEHSYEVIFSEEYRSKSGFDLDQYCYIYELPFEPSPRLSRAYQELDRLCDEWTAADRTREIDLLYEVGGDGEWVVHDGRAEQAVTLALSGAEARLLSEAESPRPLEAVTGALALQFPGQVERSLRRVRELGLVFEDAGKIVSLVLPKDEVAARRHWWDNDETRWQGVWEPDELAAARES